jgi:crotonobetainyl-CoA:carnitine CoA-transferase CaiB-like acyl-CoA transferase
MDIGKPLNGVTVIELGHSVAAPFAGLILADLGARVIKVENPDGGDYARGWGPPFWGETSSSFVSLNRGKEGITIDFGNQEVVVMLRRLITREADAVIQNLRPGVLDRFGLSPGRLREENPALIWCNIGAFGADGPLSDKPGYDPLVQASTGIMSITGESDRPPVRVGVSIVDMACGMWAVIGLLASLLARTETAKGAEVATSLYETGLAWMTIPLAGFEAAGDVRRPHGSGVAEIVPYQAFETADGWMMIAAGNDNLFRKLCSVLHLDGLVADPRYATNSARVANRQSLVAIVAEAVSHRKPDELGKALDARGIPNAPLLTVDQVACHPQTEALNMTVKPDGTNLRLMGVPLSFNSVRPRANRPAPSLGQHNVAIRKL